MPKEKKIVNRNIILQIDIETGEVLNKFESAVAAGRFLGNRDYNKHINAVCNGRRKTAYGYRWEFLKE